MRFFERRRGHRFAPRHQADDNVHGIRSALRRFVVVSTLISPPHVGNHKQILPIVTTLDARALLVSRRGSVHAPVPIVLGESTLPRLDAIFKSLCRRASTFGLMPLMSTPTTIPRGRMERFLREEQRVPDDQIYLTKDTYGFEDFLEIMSSNDLWDAQKPLSRELLDPSEPISHYFISSSHNTYLVGNQLSSDASVGEYREVLERHCRCIEIDVWNPPARSAKSSKANAQNNKTASPSNANHSARSSSSSNTNRSLNNVNRPTSPNYLSNPNSSPNGSNSKNHRRQFSSSTIATSIHDGIEAFTSIFTSRMRSRSRASSLSHISTCAPEDKSVPLMTMTPATPAAVPDHNPMSPSRTTTDMTLGSVVSDTGEGPAPSLALTDSTGLTTVTTQDENDSLFSRDAPETAEASVATVTALKAAETEQPALPPPPPSEPEPVVMHAHTWANSDWTLGTQVPFRDVCRAVRASAFVDNPMPVIVSLEVHTNAVQQRQMVKIMREEWGDLLLDASLEGTDPRLRLPTLEELYNKILVKVKKPPMVRGTVTGASTATAAGTGLSDAGTVNTACMATNAGTSGTFATVGTTGTSGTGTSGSLGDAPVQPAVVLGTSLAAVSDTASAISLPEDEGVSAATAAAMRGANFTMTPELGRLAIYTESKHFERFNDRAAKTPAHIFSLSETAIQTLHEKQHEELFAHNKKYLMRAYPNAAKHVTSSNPDPAACWRRGVQMVALNWQTLDKAMMLNHAMFDGSLGWVLKPSGFRCAANPGAGEVCPVAEAEPTGTLHLSITVLAGQHLPLPPSLQRWGGGKNAATGIMSGRGRKDFLPVVKCELNVERPIERCPELEGMAPSGPGVQTVPTVGTTVSFSDALLKKKTPAARTDQPDWGVQGATLQFANIAGIVESLSFVSIYVEDESSKTAVSLGRDSLAGWACIRLDRLQTGYRFISLMDARGNATDGKLLVLIRKEML